MYVNGSDMLLYLEDKAFGHCSTHETTLTSETKDRAVKPVASADKNSGLWKETSVTGLSISISADGLIFDGETEQSYGALLTAWANHTAIKCKCMARGVKDKPYLEGSFVISELKRTDPAQDDATYSISLKNSGQPDKLDGSVFEDAPAAPGA